MQVRVDRFPVRCVALACLALGSLGFAAWAQLSIRPTDPLGIAIREPRVRVVHSSSPEVPGTSMHLQQHDPWLAYQRGRTYFFREWGVDDGGFKYVPRRSAAASTTSCGMCHNLPFPSVGAGGNIAAEVGVGRNTPHFFGAGLLETMGMQVRQQVLAAYDDNGNGFLDVPAETRGRRAVVEVAPGVQVDYGSLDDDSGDGMPDLNWIALVRLVDAKGRRYILREREGSLGLKDPGIVGYDFTIGTFASSVGDHMFPALRVFAVGVYANIMGILPDVATTPAEGTMKGHWLRSWGQRSNAGAFLSDLRLVADPLADKDPRRRGTISEGEVDLFEWYMMNHPAPALGPQDERTRRGRALMAELGCASCHVERWQIRPHDEKLGLPGDRRFFDLEVAHNPATGRLEGKLRMLTREVPGPAGTTLLVPRRDGFMVEDVFTDLRHHDVGERFWEHSFHGGKRQTLKKFRTPPLWGLGSTAPYGHDGLSPTLDDVIRRHGGEAEAARQAYATAPPEDREAVMAFLDSLVLYQPELLPTDVDGDGRIAPVYKVAGVEMGPERFQPELLFRVAPRYRGWTEGPDGERFFSYELLNVAQAYGQDLDALRDSDGDALPDVADPEPRSPAGTAVAAGRR